MAGYAATKLVDWGKSGIYVANIEPTGKRRNYIII